MGGSKTQKNKAHKTRFASKSSRNTHKGAGTKVSGKPPVRTISHGQVAKAIRIQRNKDIRDQKRGALLQVKRAISGVSSPPRILALIALSSNIDMELLRKQIISSFSSESCSTVGDRSNSGMDVEEPMFPSVQNSFISTISVPQYKLRLSVIAAPYGDLQACLEVTKVADVIAFVIAVDSGSLGFVDNYGKKCLSMLRGAGLPMTMGLIMGSSDAKNQVESKKTAVSILQKELPDGSKCFGVDSTEECRQILRHLGEQRVSGPQWRSERPYVVSQELEYLPTSAEFGTLTLSGYVRGRTLSVNQLVHVTGVGDFQLSAIDVPGDPFPIRGQHRQLGTGHFKCENEGVEMEFTSFVPSPDIQEPLVTENTPDALAGEQTWPTEEELTKAHRKNSNRHNRKRVPKGTSEYQTSWIVDDSDSGHEKEEDNEGMDKAIDGIVLSEMDNDGNRSEDSVISEDEKSNHGPTSRAASLSGDEDDQSEMMDEDELSPAERAEEFKRLKEANTVDEEFPDEVDTPMDKPARQRFEKYRGLKSFRTSAWDPQESLPLEYGKIFSFDNFARTHKHVLAEARKVDQGHLAGSISSGVYVRLHIKGMPSHAASALLKKVGRMPVVACGLLQHESKMSVLHFSIRKNDGYREPVKSKENLIFHTGFRSYNTRPIFSTDDLNMDKHKFERFLRPGQFCLASVFAPIFFPPVSLIVFKEDAAGVKLVATGALRSVDPNQIILKRIVLSGYPHRVSKRKAVVRFMFHNPGDVRWFKPLELWTKYGRRGRIKEPVGTHGSMKCVFDGIVQQRDAVCVSLYKRVYPKWPLQ